MRTRSVLIAAATAAVLATAPAGAAIVPQKSMAGAKLGMTEKQVLAHFGTKPSSNKVVKNDILGHVRLLRYGHVTIELDGTKTSSKVITLDTNGTSQRTSAGIGVGSRRADVAAKVPGVTCKANDGGYNHCYVGKFGVAGATVTDFSINAHGRVGRVVIGIVID